MEAWLAPRIWCRDRARRRVPGETLVLYGTGFGATNPPAPEGLVVTSPAPLSTPAIVRIGGLPAEVVFGGLTATGLYQFNIKVPEGLTSGDAALIGETSGIQSPSDVFTAIEAPVAPPPPPTGYDAEISNFQFNPNPVNVSKGAKLTWTNKDGTGHTVVADSGQFRSKVLDQNDQFSASFDQPGTYNYHCSIHPFMKGQIVVK